MWIISSQPKENKVKGLVIQQSTQQSKHSQFHNNNITKKYIYLLKKKNSPFVPKQDKSISREREKIERSERGKPRWDRRGWPGRLWRILGPSSWAPHRQRRHGPRLSGSRRAFCSTRWPSTRSCWSRSAEGFHCRRNRLQSCALSSEIPTPPLPPPRTSLRPSSSALSSSTTSFSRLSSLSPFSGYTNPRNRIEFERLPWRNNFFNNEIILRYMCCGVALFYIIKNFEI